MQQDIDNQMKLLKENQKKHIESFIENLKKTELSDIKQYKAIEYYSDVYVNNDVNIFDNIKKLLYEYSALSIYHIKLLGIRHKEENIMEVEIIIGDFYWGSMMSHKSTFIIYL